MTPLELGQIVSFLVGCISAGAFVMAFSSRW